ncbi:atrial natriuretic peptide clearance receptor-like protein [Euroglyphus maynei]|uniref:Atrial natriuretic peptide clearance receptor-like protein n=1 Tax=Euroglyphus maynei TaxID=6958 RepID=A0A1Y3BQJ6_EURMA|nr:atrial natriuretic peptide clearance receptor-like protein [Euroglyphus maynei]
MLLWLLNESSIDAVQYPFHRLNNNDNNELSNHMKQHSNMIDSNNNNVDPFGLMIHPMHNVTILMLISNQKELPIHYETLKPSMEMALDEIRKKYPHINFNLITRRDHHDCESNVLGAIVAEHYFNDRIDALIGPICTEGLVQVARLASYWKLPLMTAGGVGLQFSDKTIYKTLTRVSFSLGE